MPVSSHTAQERLKGHSLVPIGDYPGAASRPWHLLCELCGKDAQESLHSVEKRTRPGCRTCCSESQNRLTKVSAEQRLRRADLRPLDPFPGRISDKWLVECIRCGKTTSTTLESLGRRKQKGCSACAKKSGRVGDDEANRRLMFAGLTALEKYPGSTKAPWKHRCSACNSVARRSLNAIESQYACGSCRKIASTKVRSDKAHQRLRAVGLEPLAEYPGASAPWKSRCMRCGETVSPTLMSAERQAPCRFCARKSATEQQLSRSRSRSMDVLSAAGFRPIGDYRGFTKPWLSVCSVCGKQSSPRPKDLLSGQGCLWCAKNAPWTVRRAEQVFRRAKRIPLEPFVSANKPLLLRCEKCDHTARSRPSSLLGSKGWCNNCKPTARWTEEKAVQVMRAAGMEPLEPYKLAKAPWKSKCLACGTIGSPAVANIANGQGGCLVCGNFGFDVRKPTTLYVLLNRQMNAFKVGITNTGSTRLRSLGRVGFVPGKLYRFSHGSEPLHIETLLLRFLRNDLNLRQALSASQMKGVGGATETFSRQDIDTRSVHARIRRLMG